MYGSKRKRRLHSVAVLLGPLSFGLTILLLEWFFGFKAAAALGTTVWMALWWIDTAAGQYFGDGVRADRCQRIV